MLTSKGSEKKIYADLRLKVKEQSAIARFGQIVLSTKNIDVLLNKAVEIVSEVLNIEYAQILKLKSDAQKLILAASFGGGRSLLGKGEVGAGKKDSLAGYVLYNKKAIISRDLQKEKRFHCSGICANHKAQSGLSVIIKDNSTVFGVLEIYAKKSSNFNKNDVNFLKSISSIISASISRLRAEEELRAWNETIRQEKLKDDAILSSLGEGVVTVNLNGQITMINNKAAELLKCGIGGAIGKSYNDIFQLEKNGKIIDQIEMRPISLALTGKIIYDNSANFILKDKTKFPVASTSSPITLDGKILGAVEIFRDITQEKNFEKIRSEFISLASHQLRTPLSTINWLSEMLLDSLSNHIEKVQKQYIESIYENNQRMVSLVNALLNVSRIESGTIAVEAKELVVKSAVSSIIDELSIQARAKFLKINFDCQPENLKIRTDLDILRIIIHNLISNSIKYSEPHSKIDFQISVKDNDILFKVKDTGMGIPEEAKDKIFSKFFRADNARVKESDGTGLGLYIVKSIVEQVGGKIWFESTEGKGSTFYVTFPKSGMVSQLGYKGLVI